MEQWKTTEMREWQGRRNASEGMFAVKGKRRRGDAGKEGCGEERERRWDVSKKVKGGGRKDEEERKGEG